MKAGLETLSGRCVSHSGTFEQLISAACRWYLVMPATELLIIDLLCALFQSCNDVDIVISSMPSPPPGRVVKFLWHSPPLPPPAGIVPKAFNGGIGAEVQKPLATIVIGGILSWTTLTCFSFRRSNVWGTRRKSERLVSQDRPI